MSDDANGAGTDSRGDGGADTGAGIGGSGGADNGYDRWAAAAEGDIDIPDRIPDPVDSISADDDTDNLSGATSGAYTTAGGLFLRGGLGDVLAELLNWDRPVLQKPQTLRAVAGSLGVRLRSSSLSPARIESLALAALFAGLAVPAIYRAMRALRRIRGSRVGQNQLDARADRSGEAVRSSGHMGGLRSSSGWDKGRD